MTYHEFLQRLRETPRDWMMFPQGRIRRSLHATTTLSCPISQLTCMPAGWWAQAADQIGLDRHLANDIVKAADNFGLLTTTTRRDLLDACGLSEAI